MTEKQARYALLALIGSYTVVFSLFTMERHLRLETSIFDLGIFDQALFLLSRGENHFLNTRGLHLHADHFHPILYLLAPLYLAWNSPLALLAAQTAIIALGAYPVYKIARHHQFTPPWALVASLCYLAHPTVSFLNRFDFHPVCFLLTALMFAVMYLELNDLLGYTISLILALSSTEAAGFTVLALAVSATYLRGRRWGVLSVMLGVGGMLLAKFWLRHFNAGKPSLYSVLYTEYGQNEVEVLAFLVKHPVESVVRLATFVNFEYLFYLFAPLALLPILSPSRLFPILPTLMGNLLSWRYSQHRIEYHYGAAIAPFLLWAAVVGWAWLRDRDWPVARVGTVLALGALAGFFFGPMGFKHTARFGPRADLAALKAIPSQDSVSADCGLGSHLTNRSKLFLFPGPFLPVAWGSTAESLVQQSSTEYPPFTRGEIRRGMESTPVDWVVLPRQDERRIFFPLRSPDSVLIREMVASSKLFKKVAERGDALVYKRSQEN